MPTSPIDSEPRGETLLRFAAGGAERLVATPGAARTALAVPGTEVAIHWLDLAGDLTPAQAAAAARLRQEILSELASADLQNRRRVSFYALGAGLALLLDQDGADWKARYLTDKFFMERYAGVRHP